jgi:hypothetical protein
MYCTSEKLPATMALELFIPPCIHTPRHEDHPPSPYKPLRVEIQGPLETIQKLLPDISWHPVKPFPQPGGQALASLVHRSLYGDDLHFSHNKLPIRHEYLAWTMEGRKPLEYVRVIEARYKASFN